jgi:hypothetical protein
VIGEPGGAITFALTALFLAIKLLNTSGFI